MITLLCLLIAFLFVLFLGTTRNDWVRRKRIRLIWHDFASYERLPSYVYMVLCFWVWDVKKFIREEK